MKKNTAKFFALPVLIATVVSCKPGPITLGGGTPVLVKDSQGQVSYVNYHVDKKQMVTVQKSGGSSLIANKISAAFAQDKLLSPYNINVTADRHGKVTLVGTVPNSGVKSYAIKVARYTKGVVAVSAKNLVIGNQ